jgi:chromatin segregation and condensation protein Rec8/ScpA/Scc1 (kleisin family)
LKSRAMLPHLGGERDCDLEQDDLVGRLATYRSFKLLAQMIAEIERQDSAVYAGGSGRAGALEELTGTLARICIEDLGLLMRGIRDRQVHEKEPATRPVPRVTVADRLAILNEGLAEHGSLDWTAVAGARVDEIVATLLAVLELVRRGRVRIDQRRLFGPIRLSALQEGAIPSSSDAVVGQAELA